MTDPKRQSPRNGEGSISLGRLNEAKDSTGSNTAGHITAAQWQESRVRLLRGLVQITHGSDGAEVEAILRRVERAA